MWPQARHSGVPRPTLHDVAREAGVSARTVSRVLNEEPRISAETRQRVLAVVRRLGFRPNAMARNMRVGARDAAVGLVIPDLGNPFFGTVASGVERRVLASLLMAVTDATLTLLLNQPPVSAPFGPTETPAPAVG